MCFSTSLKQYKSLFFYQLGNYYMCYRTQKLLLTSVCEFKTLNGYVNQCSLWHTRDKKVTTEQIITLQMIQIKKMPNFYDALNYPHVHETKPILQYCTQTLQTRSTVSHKHATILVIQIHTIVKMQFSILSHPMALRADTFKSLRMIKCISTSTTTGILSLNQLLIWGLWGKPLYYCQPKD